ncbi:MAG: hypothetical protein P4L87_19205 [Formivibrio sp.]|nr:hypothetical protein [Formivibrio sp.]
MTQVKSRSATAMRKHTRDGGFLDILAFLIPCLQFVQLQVIGVINGSDLLLLGVFVFLALRMRIRISTPAGKWFMILCSLWLASQCVTDIVRRSALSDYARGWSNIGMTLINFAVLCTLLHGRPRRLVLFGWGLVAGSVLAYYINPNKYAEDYPWKFGVSYPITMAVLLLASRSKCRGRWPVVLVTTIGLINIYLGTRNTGAACLCAALYLQVTRYLQRKGAATPKLNTKVVVAIAASIILGGVTILWAYKYAASRGILGESAQVKYENQSSGQYGILLSGRKELLGSLSAIYDSPILGHGSWARDPIYLIEARQALAAMGYEDAWDMASDTLEEGYIPTHSYLLGAWVDAGIVGALFWGWIFVLTARTLMHVYARTVVLLPVAAFIAFLMLWDTLFSPYGGMARILMPYYLLTLMTCYSMVPYKAVPATIGATKRYIDASSEPRP